MFKNVITYQLATLPAGAHTLEYALKQHPSKEIGALQAQVVGWQSYYPNEEVYTLHVKQYVFFKLNVKTKLLPAKVVNAELAKRVNDLEIQEERKIGKKEKVLIKDQLVFELLPRAFVQEQTIEAFIDTSNKLLFIDTPSFAKAELLLYALREALGSLEAYPLVVNNAVPKVFEEMLSTPGSPDWGPFGLLGSYKVQAENDPCKVTMRGIPSATNAQQVLFALDDNDMQIVETALYYNDSLSFNLDESFRIKGLKGTPRFYAEYAEQRNLDGPNEDLLADHLLVGTTVGPLVTQLTGLFGGLLPAPTNENAPLAEEIV